MRETYLVNGDWSQSKKFSGSEYTPSASLTGMIVNQAHCLSDHDVSWRAYMQDKRRGIFLAQNWYGPI